MVVSVGVVGGGLCGLATTWHLCSLPEVTRVVVYDGSSRFGVARGGGDGFYNTASSVAAGLLHPLTPRLKVAWEADSALSAANELLAAAGHEECTDLVLRPCRGHEDAESVRLAAERLGPRYLEWFDPSEFETLTRDSYGSPIDNFGGVRIVGGKVVDVSKYLSELYEATKSKGTPVEWCEEKVDDLDLLKAEHDVVVCCGGAAAASMYEAHGVESLTMTYSQSLIFSDYFDPAVVGSPALLRGDYLCPASSNRLVVGSTRDNFDPATSKRTEPVSVVAERLGQAMSLAANMRETSPMLAKTTAGIRLNGPRTHHGRLPFVGVRDGLVLAGGLGSRGLLRHSQIGQIAAIAAVSGNDEHVPLPLRAKFASFVSQRPCILSLLL